ncbi:MAG: hypothetical protein MUC49_15570 [Raineya sp.]|jgi:hypothetical protein|nr:hypothetical protein [Raineya sp.]
MQFLPVNSTEDFEIPSKADQFLSFKEEGEYQVRIMSRIIEGYVFFSEKTNDENSKPIRRKIKRDPNDDKKILKESYFTNEELQKMNAKTITKKSGEKVFEDPKYFWAFLVFNQKTQKFQVLEITQKSLIAGILGYLKKQSWADPTKYDFVITKKGSGLNSEYSIMGELPTELPDEVLLEHSELQYNLDNIFHDKYPFEQ